MREKAIERLEAKKPKALGSRITVQRLGDIAILNFYYNKILKARYCINSETGEVIDINKLADTDGDKTVAIDSFEGNNLVLVDEGHRDSLAAWTCVARVS